MAKMLIPAFALFVACPIIAYAAFVLKKNLSKVATLEVIGVLAVIYIVSAIIFNKRNGQIFAEPLYPWAIGSAAFLLMYLLV